MPRAKEGDFVGTVERWSSSLAGGADPGADIHHQRRAGEPGLSCTTAHQYLNRLAPVPYTPVGESRSPLGYARPASAGGGAFATDGEETATSAVTAIQQSLEPTQDG